MAYNPTIWVNNSYPSLNETNLNKMEDGIVQAHSIAETSANEARYGRTQFSNNLEMTAGTEYLKAISPARLKELLDVRLQGVIENLGGVTTIQSGTHTTRPIPGVSGRVYLSTDTGMVSRDTGIVWEIIASLSYNDLTNKPDLTPAGIGAAPASHVGSGGTAHSVGTTTSSGFISTADKTKLDGLNSANYIPVVSPYYAGDLNAISGSGFWKISRGEVSVVNAPPQSTGEHPWIYLTQIDHSSTHWKTQTARDFNGVAEYARDNVNGVWGAWAPIPFKTDKVNLDKSVLIGEIKTYAGSNEPAGWLICDGRALGRTVHPALFAAIGTIWGAGDGTTTFNIPDLRGRVPIGTGTGTGLTARALASQYGAETHVLSAGEMPYHNHGGTTSGVSANHVHSYNGGGDKAVAAGTNGSAANTAAGNTGPNSANHSHTFATDYRGGNVAHTNMQPSVGVTYLIRIS